MTSDRPSLMEFLVGAKHSFHQICTLMELRKTPEEFKADCESVLWWNDLSKGEQKWILDKHAKERIND